MATDDLLLSDLTCALPRDGWTDADSTVHKPIAAAPAGKWRIIDYKTDHYDGRALLTTCPDAAPLRIPLGRAGWHAVSIGMSERQWGQAAIDVRLTGMPHWQRLKSDSKDTNAPLHEEPWIFADLTGCDLEIRYPAGLDRTTHTTASVYSVRLTPIRAGHLPVVQARRHRPLAFINDGFGIFYRADKAGPHIVGDALGAWKDSDWDVCCFGTIGADIVNYPSRTGVLCGADGWDMARAGDVQARDNLRAMVGGGGDPLKQAIDLAHAQSQRCWFYLRPQAWVADPPYDHILRSRFYQDHPEFRCAEANGKPIVKLSIAYPEVRARMNAILAEGLARGADGITLAFVRGYPLVRYEQPVLDRFRALHGKDARELADTDAALLAVWAEFVAAWLREVRAVLDAAGPSPLAKRRELTAIVGPDLEWNLRFGFDVTQWAHEGLVDVIMPYPYRKPREGEVNVAEFAQAIAGTPMQLLPSFGSFVQSGTLADVRQRVHGFYRAGAHGLSRWDASPALARLRLDDPEIQALWCEHYMPPQYIEMTEFAGLNLECFGPMLGF